MSGKKKATAAAGKATNKQIKSGIKGWIVSPGKNNRDKLFIVGCLAGVIIVYLTDASGTKASFRVPCFKELENNEDLAEELGVNLVCPRKGEDGETPMTQGAGSPYWWKQLVLSVGVDANTPRGRSAKKDELLQFFNERANARSGYRFPKRVEFGGDLTASPMKTCDKHLLDEHALAVMFAAYPETPREELAEMEVVVGNFFEDVDRGQTLLRDMALNLPSDEEEENDEGIVDDDGEDDGEDDYVDANEEEDDDEEGGEEDD